MDNHTHLIHTLYIYVKIQYWLGGLNAFLWTRTFFNEILFPAGYWVGLKVFKYFIFYGVFKAFQFFIYIALKYSTKYQKRYIIIMYIKKNINIWWSSIRTNRVDRYLNCNLNSSSINPSYILVLKHLQGLISASFVSQRFPSLSNRTRTMSGIRTEG